jgi:hypothetical protein
VYVSPDWTGIQNGESFPHKLQFHDWEQSHKINPFETINPEQPPAPQLMIMGPHNTRDGGG